MSFSHRFYETLTGITPTDLDLNMVGLLDVLGAHLFAIINSKRGETIFLHTRTGRVEVTRHAPSWEESNPVHDQFRFTVSLDNTGHQITNEWVGNLYGAIQAYIILWQATVGSEFTLR